MIGKDVAEFISHFAAIEKASVSGRDKELAVATNPLDDSLFGFQNPDFLLQARGIELYDEMRDDDAVGAYLDMKKSARLATGWSVIPASDEQEHIDQAAHIEFMFSEMKGTLKDKLRDILSALDYGYSVTNKPLTMYESGPFKGKIGISTLKTKEPQRVKFKLDDFRNVTGIVHENARTMKLDDLDISQFIIYTYRSEFANPYGRSDFRRAFKWWNVKKYVMKMWPMWLERFAGGFLDVEFVKDRTDPDEHAIIEAFMKDMSSPRTGLLHSDLYKVVMNESAGRGGDSYQKAIEAINRYIARAILIPQLLMETSQSGAGAFALGKKHADVFLWVLEDLGEDLSETIIGEQMIKPIIDMNYANVEVYPRFAFDPLTDDQKEFILSKLFEAIKVQGISTGIDIENFIREMIGAPLKKEDEEEDEHDEFEDHDDDDDLFPPVKGDDDDFGDDDFIRNASGDGLRRDDHRQRTATAASARKRTTSTSNVVVVLQEARLRREPTELERKIDLRAFVKQTNSSEKEFSSVWAQLMESSMNAMIKTLERKKIIENKDRRAINDLKLTRTIDMKKALARHMLTGTYFGALQAQNELDRSKLSTQTQIDEHIINTQFATAINTSRLDLIAREFEKRGLSLTPLIRSAAAAARQEAFFVTGVTTDAALKKAQQIIFRGIRRGNFRWTANQLRKTFEGFIEQGVIADTGVANIFRTETIAQTNFNSAVNQARLVQFEDPDVSEFVVAYQYSAIIDTGTTPYCIALDTKVFRKDEMIDEGFPPAHHRCRSLVNAITRGEAHTLVKIPRAVSRAANFTALQMYQRFARLEVA